MFNYEETKTAYEECNAACNALKEFIDVHSVNLTDSETKTACAALTKMLNRRATLKARLNMCKYISE